MPVYDADMDTAWVEAKVETRGEAPPGTYQAKIESIVEKVEGEERKLKGRLRVISGPHNGATIWKNWQVNKESAKWLKQDSQTCGFKFDSYSEMKASLEAFKGIALEVAVVTSKKNPKYSNVYFNRRIDIMDDFPDTEESGGAPF